MAVSVPGANAQLTESTATWPPKRMVSSRVSSSISADQAGWSHLALSEPHPAPSPLVGEGWGEGCLLDSADLMPSSRLAHAKSDVSDMAKVKTEIGNCRFRLARDIAMLASRV